MLSKCAHDLMEEFAFHNWLIHHILEGVTHEESLLELPFETSSLNWVLGHVVNNRSHVLEVAGVPHEWRDEVRELYHTGTPSTKPGDDAIHIEALLEYLDTSTGLIRTALEKVSHEWLAEHFRNYRGDKTRDVHLSGFHWHEGFHIGQLEMLRDFVLTVRKSQIKEY